MIIKIIIGHALQLLKTPTYSCVFCSLKLVLLTRFHALVSCACSVVVTVCGMVGGEKRNVRGDNDTFVHYAVLGRVIRWMCVCGSHNNMISTDVPLVHIPHPAYLRRTLHFTWPMSLCGEPSLVIPFRPPHADGAPDGKQGHNTSLVNIGLLVTLYLWTLFV